MIRVGGALSVRRAVLSAAVGVAAVGAGLVNESRAGILQDFNILVTQDMFATSDYEGRAFIGRDLAGPGSTFATQISPPAFVGVDTLIVGRHIQVNNQINLNAGNLRIGGTRTGGLNLNGPGAQQIDDPSVQTLAGDYSAILQGTSAAMSALTPNSTVAPAPMLSNRLRFTANPDANGLAVFDLPAGTLFGNGTFESIDLELNGATAIVINVAGAALTTTFNMVGDWTTPFVRANTMWNFVEAASLTVDRNFNGAILAPEAHLTNTTSIDGSVFVRRFTANGQVHQPNYTGFDPGIPAPGAGVLLAFGAAMAGSRRRQR
ncbi:MAG: choice-of-anchor A family protein [Phycisphaeraceae bacterium]|nr:choice-of-anchor A family protein [Phycisphaeraceae bacterium]